MISKRGCAALLLTVPGVALATLQLEPEQADAVALNTWLSAAADQGGQRCTEARVLPPLPARLRGHVTLTGWQCELQSQARGKVRRYAQVQVRLTGARYAQWPTQRVQWQTGVDLDDDSPNPGMGLRVWVAATQAQLLPAWQADGAAEQTPDGSWQRYSNGGATLTTLRCGPRGAAPCEIGDFLVP